MLLGSSTCNGGYDILDARGWPGRYISYYPHGYLLETLVMHFINMLRLGYLMLQTVPGKEGICL